MKCTPVFTPKVHLKHEDLFMFKNKKNSKQMNAWSEIKNYFSLSTERLLIKEANTCSFEFPIPRTRAVSSRLYSAL